MRKNRQSREDRAKEMNYKSHTMKKYRHRYDIKNELCDYDCFFCIHTKCYNEYLKSL